MKMDAQAIANGDATMVDLNARLAKQEFLGVATIWKQQQEEKPTNKQTTKQRTPKEEKRWRVGL